MKNSKKINRSNVWKQIYKIVKQLPIKNVGGVDVMDAPSATTEIEALFIKNQKQIPDTIPYQLCPKCGGDGIVLVQNWFGSPTSISSGTDTCNLCNGAMIIPMYVLPKNNVTFE